VAAGARRARRLPAGALPGARAEPCRSGDALAAGAALTQDRRNGRDRRGGAAQVAQLPAAAAGSGRRARRLVAARRARAGGGPFRRSRAAASSTPAARVHRAPTTSADAASGGWFFQNGPAARLRRAGGGALVWRRDVAGELAVAHRPRGALRGGAAGRGGRLFVAADLGLGSAHARHGGGGEPCSGACRSRRCAFRACGALRLPAQPRADAT